MTLPSTFPFSKLKLPDGEVLWWVGYNPTFHRFWVYGLAITDLAFYLCSRGWLFARWRRYLLAEISDVVLVEGGGRPRIEFRVGEKKVTFVTPFDSHEDETEFDRSVLQKAVDCLRSKNSGAEAAIAGAND